MRINGTFDYRPVGDVQTDPATGFVVSADDAPFLKGCECQIDKSIPAKQVVGTDGQIYAYNYDVFIPKYFNGELAIGCTVRITSEDGVTDDFSVLGIDDMNRKYIEIWG